MAEFKAIVDRTLSIIADEAKRYIKDSRMVPYPRAGLSQLNVRTGALRASIGHLENFGSTRSVLRIGPIASDPGKGIIAWHVQEMKPFSIYPVSRRYLTIPLAPAMTPTGVKIARSAPEYSRRVSPLFFKMYGRKAFLATAKNKQIILVYRLKEKVRTRRRDIMDLTVKNIVLPRLKSIDRYFTEAKIYIRGQLHKVVKGKAKP